MKLTEWKELTDKFSKKESWDREHKYISTTGFILGTLFGLLLSYLLFN